MVEIKNVTIRKYGTSAVIPIPADFIRHGDLQLGDQVNVVINLKKESDIDANKEHILP